MIDTETSLHFSSRARRKSRRVWTCKDARSFWIKALSSESLSTGLSVCRSVGLAGWVGGLVHLYSSNFYTFEGKSAK
jgi:hypothetical protein